MRFIKILFAMMLLTTAAVQAYSYAAPVYGVLPNNGLTYVRYPTYGTSYEGYSHTYDDYNLPYNKYWQERVKFGNYYGHPYFYYGNGMYATSHKVAIHYVDRPILYPGAYKFRPMGWYP